MIDTESARNALEDARRVRAELAGKAGCPPAWHFAFGGLMGAVVAAQAGSPAVAISLEAACAVAVVLIATVWKRRLGFFINGYRRGRTRRVTFALLAAFLLIYATSIYLKLSHGLVWAPLAGGAMMTPIAAWASVVWQRVYRAELLGEGKPQ